MTIYVYPDEEIEETISLCESTYALTGAIFAQDRAAIVDLEKKLTHTAGNYINDKPTGAIVGQQPLVVLEPGD